MLSEIKCASFSVCPINEDVGCALPNAAWVLDGSTGLNNRRLVAAEDSSDAAWYAAEFSSFLTEHISDPTRSLAQIFSDGVRAVWGKFRSLHRDDEVSPEDVPCTLATAVRVVGEKLEYIVVGDCPLLLRYRDNRVCEILDNTLPRLDAESVKIGIELSESHKIPFSECRELLLPRLKAVRLLAGREEGYVALADRPESPLNALCGDVPVDSITDFCILSDGFSEYYKLFCLCDTEEFIRRAETQTPEALFSEILQAQENDRSQESFPRFKFSDDATIVYAKLN